MTSGGPPSGCKVPSHTDAQIRHGLSTAWDGGTNFTAFLLFVSLMLDTSLHPK